MALKAGLLKEGAYEDWCSSSWFDFQEIGRFRSNIHAGVAD